MTPTTTLSVIVPIYNEQSLVHASLSRLRVLGNSPLLTSIRVIVVDDDIDARNWKDVMWAISTRMDPARDITLVENTPIDYLDFASPESGLGSKIGLDATDKWPPETRREWGRKLDMSEDVRARVAARWEEFGLD